MIHKIAQLCYIFELENQMAMQSGAHRKVRAEKVILGGICIQKMVIDFKGSEIVEKEQKKKTES